MALGHSTDGIAHHAVGTVAADHMLCPDSDLAVRRIESHSHSLTGCLRHFYLNRLVAVVDLKAAGRVVHVLQQEVEQPCLVNDHVRELGQSVANVLHAAKPGNPGLVTGGRAPEMGLVDPVGLAGHPLG